MNENLENNKAISKKNLDVNSVHLDLTHVTPETLSRYESIKLNAVYAVITPQAQELLSRYPVDLNSVSTFEVQQPANLIQKNGTMEICPGLMPSPNSILMVNGVLMLRPDCQEVLQSYLYIMVNGKLFYPENQPGLAQYVQLNGTSTPCPPKTHLQSQPIVVDPYLHLQLEEEDCLYTTSWVELLDPEMDLQPLIQKNIRFGGKKAYVAQSLAGDAAKLLLRGCQLIVLPNHCKLVTRESTLNSALIAQYGRRIHITKTLQVPAQAALLLPQLEYLCCEGNVQLDRSLESPFLEKFKVQGSIHYIEENLISDQTSLLIDSSLLSLYPKGLRVANCVDVTISDDLDLETASQRLLFLQDCVSVICPKPLLGLVRSISRDVVSIQPNDSEKAPDQDTVVSINAVSYVL